VSDLNERVCRKMGIEHLRNSAHSWASECPFYSRYLNDDQNDAVCNCPRTKVYPDLLTPEWAGKLLEMLSARGIPLTVKYQPVYAEPWSCGEAHGPLLWRAHKTLAEAVCLAIDSMEVQS
jgi:hypothetical protein